MKKIKIAAVSYLNTKPLLYGLVQDETLEKAIDLELDIPSACADKLISGEVDLGLIPVGAIPKLKEAGKEAHIVSDYCIGCDGEVKTVCIYSDCPIEEIKELYLDHHSRTSVRLVQILLKDYWKQHPTLLKSEEGFIDKIKAQRAGVVIGDRTIGLDKKHKYVYDLGETWKLHTGLPFVFATWVSTVPLSEPFTQKFNKALADGIANIPKLVYLLPNPHADFDLKEYFSKYISYHLDESKRKSLALFLSKISQELPQIITQ
ncbi:MAG: menaquinone biosynthetic enzyme MqnA/MqnD family protein [Saprospiraceae bacterium]